MTDTEPHTVEVTPEIADLPSRRERAVDLDATPFRCDWAMVRDARWGSKALLAAMLAKGNA